LGFSVGAYSRAPYDQVLDVIESLFRNRP
jgi:hypothetical protein